MDINEIDVKESLTKNNKIDLIDKFEQFTMNYYIMQHPEDVSCCPTPGCNYVFVYEEGDNYYECPICEKEYCLKCKSDWHKDKTCQEFQEYRRVGLLGKDQKQLDNLFYDFAKGSKFKQCPYCKNWVEKNEGCAIFNYSFKLNGYYINLVQLSDGVFDLKINDFFFKDLMEYEESGQLKKDREKREKNKDLKEEDNIDINAEYNPKSRKDRNNMHKNNKKNDLIDED